MSPFSNTPAANTTRPAIARSISDGAMTPREPYILPVVDRMRQLHAGVAATRASTFPQLYSQRNVQNVACCTVKTDIDECGVGAGAQAEVRGAPGSFLQRHLQQYHRLRVPLQKKTFCTPPFRSLLQHGAHLIVHSTPALHRSVEEGHAIMNELDVLLCQNALSVSWKGEACFGNPKASPHIYRIRGHPIL